MRILSHSSAEERGRSTLASVDAVENRTIDVAIVWGPLAGYFAKRSAVPLNIVPVSPQFDPPGLPFTFEISVGVQPGNVALRDEIQTALDRNNSAIQAILNDYGVPRI